MTAAPLFEPFLWSNHLWLCRNTWGQPLDHWRTSHRSADVYVSDWRHIQLLQYQHGHQTHCSRTAGDNPAEQQCFVKLTMWIIDLINIYRCTLFSSSRFNANNQEKVYSNEMTHSWKQKPLITSLYLAL